MKTMMERIRRRLRKDRPTTTVTIRLPVDVIEDLQEIAPTLGYSGYLPLIRSYIGHGLRDDLFKLQNSPLQAITEELRSQGISDELIAAVMTRAKQKSLQEETLEVPPTETSPQNHSLT